MKNTPRTRIGAAIVALVLALGVGIGAAAVIADDDPDDTPLPVEPDGGIGDTPLPVEPDGGIGDTPLPVEPDGGIGDTPGDEFPVDLALQEAQALLGVDEADLPADVRVGRKGEEYFALTEDYVLGRITAELDDEDGRYRVTAVTVELPAGPETLQLTPG